MALPGRKSPQRRIGVTQSKRTAKSNKKTLAGIDQLKPLIERFPGEKVHRTDVPDRIRTLLASKGRDGNSKKTVHEFTIMFREIAFRYELGQEVDLETVWKEILPIVAELASDLAHSWNNDEHRNIFIWQTVGHILSPSSMPGIAYQGDAAGYLDAGKFVPFPDDNPGVPRFLCPGDTWCGKEVFSHIVKNMCCDMALFRTAIRLALPDDPAR